MEEGRIPGCTCEDPHVTSGILRIRNESEIIREPLALKLGVSNLELRTPEHPNIMYQMTSSRGALPKVPGHSEELTRCRCPGFVTGTVAKKGPLPSWILVNHQLWLRISTDNSLCNRQVTISEKSALHCGSSAKERARPTLVGEAVDTEPPAAFPPLPKNTCLVTLKISM